VAARYWATGSASEVGGDFYDVFPFGENRFGVVIGDVCGTGPQAAAVIAIARHTIRAAVKHGAGPVEVLEWVNEALHAGERDLFCTAFFAVLEHLGGGRYRFEGVAGGHPLPMVVRADGTTEWIGQWGTLLGVLPEISATSVTTELEPGDTLVLHTDGVHDIAPPHNLSQEALADIVRAAAERGEDASAVATLLGMAIEDILPIPQRTDDIALVVIRFGD
jgi:sigma-B regulation protein RsbU (phosphoserine phosphatase)